MNWLKLYRDPNLIEPVKVDPSSVQQEIPKTKEDWEKLAKDNPTKWAELTQPRMDAAIREARETKERLAAFEAREKNLLTEIEKLKQPSVQQLPEGEEYGRGRYPQTEEEWNDLFLERPTFANDLRNMYFNEQQSVQNEFITVRTDSAKKVQQEHPDMYLHELDETGKVKLDGQGKPILKIDPVTKAPLFNDSSEKGKLWIDIWNEDPKGWSALKNAPSLMMAEMERRLRIKGATMVNQGQNNLVNEDPTAIAPRGVTPPMASSLKFESVEEKTLAERAVSRGTYKSLEEYCKWRDSKNYGYAETNSRPDFTRK